MATGVVLTKKPDGSWRFCCDYRKLNAVTAPDCYPLPRIDATLMAMAGAEWLSSHDLTSSFWQTRMCEADGGPGKATSREKTAFVTASGQYVWNFMPFGLRNATAHQQRQMDTIMDGIHWVFATTYVDDVNVYSTRGWEEHLEHLREFYGRLRQAGLRLKPKKCKLGRRRLETLGHSVDREGRRPAEGIHVAITGYGQPTT